MVRSKIVATNLQESLSDIYVCQITDLTETWFGSLVTFSASNNDFGSLSTVCDSVETLPLTVRSLSLDGNGFTSLDDVAVLANLPHLQTLSLKNNSIRTVGPQSNEQSFPVFAQSLFDVDLSFNAIDSWAVIDRLQDAFPGLTALRVSHNPLYQDLRSGDGRPLNYDNGYTLTVARIGRLKTLNFSRVSLTPKICWARKKFINSRSLLKNDLMPKHTTSLRLRLSFLDTHSALRLK